MAEERWINVADDGRDFKLVGVDVHHFEYDESKWREIISVRVQTRDVGMPADQQVDVDTFYRTGRPPREVELEDDAERAREGRWVSGVTYTTAGPGLTDLLDNMYRVWHKVNPEKDCRP